MSTHPRHAQTRASVFVASLAVAATGILGVAPPHAAAVSTTVVISQVYGGGGNSGATFKNDFIELYNLGSTAVDLTDWSVQYGSAGGSTWTNRTNLSGTIQPGHYYLVQEAAGAGGTVFLPTPNATGTIALSANAGKVALVSSTTALSGSCPSGGQIIDFVGYGNTSGNTANCSETGPAPTLSNTTAALRIGSPPTDTDDNGADFVAGTPNPRNSAWPLTGAGSATPSVLSAGDATLLTVAVTPSTSPTSTGIGVTCNLAEIGGPATQMLYDDGTNGDAAVGDNTFSFATKVTAATSGGTKSLPCSIGDAQSRATSATIVITVVEILPIGAVNGPVPDSDSCAAHTSPYVGQTVTVQGVIYEKTLQAISNSTNTYKGFYIQNTAETADTDPTTSDGLFVYMGTYATLIGGYAPVVGDEVVLSGKISEYYNMTELGSASLVGLIRSGVDIADEVAPVEANPPVALAEANCYWERLQGMRVQVPEGSIVLGGRNVFSPSDAEIWVAAPNSTIAQRTTQYTDRAFRDAHPLDDNYNPTSWDGNGYRILMGSLGIKAAAGDAQALIDPARTFDTVTNIPAGGLNYTYSKYRIEISEQPTFSLGPDPSQNDPPVVETATQYTIADYNLENLYDYRNNPFSGCDFAGDSGCPLVAPFLSAVTPPYDYVPASEAAYQARLTDIATQIVNDLHSPDILMVQEVENQDICSVLDGAMSCGTTDNADGKPDVLQDLALKVASLGGPAYDAAWDRDSSDLRGIAPAYLYRIDRVQLVPPQTGDPVLGENPVIGGYTSVPYDSDVSNPKTLNAVYTGAGACETSWVFPRAPDVALFRVWATGVGSGNYADVYTINNHFKSGPDTCVAHRTEQAKYNAALVQYLETAMPDARVVVAGDLNVYPRPDDPFAPIGQAGSSDQLGSLYPPSSDLTNLWSVLVGTTPASAYSYVYLGQAQTLDQVFANASMMSSLQGFRIAHINSDFPADYPGDVARGTSDHDPNVATFLLYPFSGFLSPIDAAPTLNVLKAGAAVPVKFSLGGDQGLNILAAGYPQSQQIDCTTLVPSGSPAGTTAAGSSGLRYDATAGQYIYAWKTDKAWAGTCRAFILKLADGTTHEADFQFTK